MAMVQEFKTFIQRGNVMDMAVGDVGGAFGRSSPGWSATSSCRCSLFRRGLQSRRKIGGTDERGALGWQLDPGHLDFLILAFCVFLLVRQSARASPQR
jgi:hypothetical protein